MKSIHFHIFTLFVVLVATNIYMEKLGAAVLPEDRADVMYHAYEGGGMEITGPSILVRKSLFNKVSVSANYYIDNVSSASIDVLSNASPYTERRVEKSIGFDILQDKTLISLGYTNSEENDYSAKTGYISISQDFFGDLTSLSIGYSRGDDTIGRRASNNGVTIFETVGEAQRQNYRLNLTQIITKNMIMSLGIEGITDEGFLNNPYRSVRISDGAGGVIKESEIYPETRTSQAVSIAALYYLPYRASIKLEARTFSDTWEITSNQFELAYTHPYKEHWIFEAKYRTYSQTQAEFYRDIFFQRLEFQARDKELSSFSDATFGIGVSYERKMELWNTFDKFSVNLLIDYIQFDYENFRNELITGFAAGEEPLYSFDATVTRLFFSIWY